LRNLLVARISVAIRPLALFAILILAAFCPVYSPFAVCQKADPVDVARRYLAENAKQWGIDPSLSDLSLVRLTEGKSASNVVFQQVSKGIKVRDAFVSVLVTKDNKPILNTLRYHPSGAIAALDLSQISALSNASAVAVAREYVGVRGDLRGAVSSEIQIDFDGKRFQPVWRVFIPSLDPLGDWEVLVTEENVPISKMNLMRFVSGQGYVFNPNPIVTSGDTSLVSNGNSESSALNNQRQLVTLLGLDGTGYLRGNYVDLTAPGISGGYRLAGQAYSPTFSYLYTRGDSKFEEVMVYYHVDLAQRYIQSLGFQNINNRAIPVHAHYMRDANAFYSYAGYMGFGDSVPNGPESAEDADVIVHEYGHAVLDNQDPGIYTWEGGSIHEGFADYLSATLFEGVPGPYGAAYSGEWFARAWGGSWVRRVDEFRRYPDDMLGHDTHYDGQIWSGTLWDIHQALGRTTANRIILESNFYLTAGAGFMDAARAVLLADQVMTDGANQETIRGILSNHGLSVPSGVLPYDVSYPSYSWVDGISGGVMIGPGNIDDAIYGPVSLGFSFPYYDISGPSYKTQVKITTNGYLTFSVTDTSVYYSNTVIPRQQAPNDAIYPYWQDLYVTSSGGIYYKAESNRFIITWKDMRRYGHTSDSPFTFEVILYSDGRVWMQYQSYDPTGGLEATIGLENQDGSRAKLWSYKYAWLSSGITSVLFAQLVQIAVTSSPTGSGYVTVDGSAITTPQTFSWMLGSSHTLAANSPISGGTGIQYVWVSWSDSGAQSHTITVPPSATTYTTIFKKQYMLTTAVNPTGAGTLSVSSGWRDAGTTISVTATANTGYSFYYWSLDGSNVGNNLSYSVVMASPHSLTAYFRGTSSMSLALSAGSIALGSSVTLSGTITPAQPSPGISTGTTVTVSYSLDSGATWTAFVTMQTASGGAYSFVWYPPYPNIYQIKASWSGDSNYQGSTSSTVSLTVTGIFKRVTLLVSGPTSTARGNSATFDVLLNNADSPLTTTLYFEVLGPGGYWYFDTQQITVTASGKGRFQFTWQVPSTASAGQYQVFVGLIPPKSTAIAQTQITVQPS